MTGVHPDHLGLPYFGGPRYTITWEDGLVEQGVNKYELLKIYANTPASLGAVTELDDDLRRMLIRIGSISGTLFGSRRREDGLAKLRHTLQEAAKAIDVARACLRTMGQLLRSAESVGVIGADARGMSSQVLVTSDRPEGDKITVRFVSKEVLHACVKARGFAVWKTSGDRICFASEVPVEDGFVWSSGGKRGFTRILLCALTPKQLFENPELLSNQKKILLDVVSIMSDALATVGRSNLRKEERRRLLDQAETDVTEFTISDPHYLYHRCLYYASSALPGANVYFGLLEDSRDTIEFKCATLNSQMTSKRIRRPEGLSFVIVDSLEVKIIESLNVGAILEGDKVHIRYGNKVFDGTVRRLRGHNFYDVIYNDGTSEAAVPSVRLKKITAIERMKVFGEFRYPVIFVPLRNKDKGMGVIAADDLESVLITTSQTHMEGATVIYLKNIGRIFGSAIDIQQKKSALAMIERLGNGINANDIDVLEALFNAIHRNVLSITSTRIVKYTNERINGRDSSSIAVLIESGPDDAGLRRWLVHYDHLKSSRKAVQIKGNQIKLVFFLRNSGAASRPKIYLAAFSNQNFNVFEPDIEFLESMQKTALNALQKITPRKVRTLTRDKFLNDVKIACSQWFAKSKSTLLNEIHKFLRVAFRNANILVGRVGPGSDTLHIFHTSTESRLSDCTFHRLDEEVAAFFKVIDSKVATVLSKEHCCMKDCFKSPLVIIPLIAHDDTCIGVLCVDGFGEQSFNYDMHSEEVRLFCIASSYLTFALDQHFAQEARSIIDNIIYSSTTITEGLTMVRESILTYLPDLSSVSFVNILPKLHAVAAGSSISSDLVVFVSINDIQYTEQLDSPHLKIIASGKLHYDSFTDSSPPLLIKAIIESGTMVHQEALSISLSSMLDSKETQISQTSILVHEALKAPSSTAYRYVLTNPRSNFFCLAEISLTISIFETHEIVAFRLKKISVKCVVVDGKRSPLRDATVTLRNGNAELKRCNFTACDESTASVNLNVILSVNNLESSIHFRSDNFNGMAFFRVDEVCKIPGNQCAFIVEDNLNSNAIEVTIFGSVVDATSISASEYYLSCFDELHNHDPRDLRSSFARGSIIAPSTDSVEVPALEYVISALELRNINFSGLEDASQSVSVRFTFNGVEVGRTSTISDSLHPMWYKEDFLIRVPGNVELSSSSLDVEVLNEAKLSLLGSYSVFGRRLVYLLTGDRARRKWCRLTPPKEIPDTDDLFPEILLQGRPASTPVSDVSGDVDGFDDFLRLTVLEATDFPLLRIFGSPPPPSSTIFLRFFFNNRVVHETKGLPADEKSFRWEDEVVVFRGSSLLLLEQSTLRVELWLLHSERFRVLLTSTTLKGWDMIYLFGQRGIRYLWFPIEFHAERTILSRAQDAVMNMIGTRVESRDRTGKIKLGGGAHIYHTALEDDGRTYFVDILAAASIYGQHIDGPIPLGFKQEVYFSVYWNSKLIGTTAKMAGTDPVWHHERFILRTPLRDAIDSLHLCELHLEAWVMTAGEKVCLGYIDFTRDELEDFLTTRGLEWYTITPSSNRYATSTTSYTPHEGHALLRGGTRTTSNLETEACLYQLQVLSAKRLPRIDLFQPAIPFFTVKMNGKEIFRSSLALSSQNPIFNQTMNLIFSSRDEKMLSSTFVFTVYSAGDFLCEGAVSGQILSKMVNSGAEFDIQMISANDKLLRVYDKVSLGSLVAKIISYPLSVTSDPLYDLSDLWDLRTPLKNLMQLDVTIMAAKGLRKANLVGLSDPYCVVKWCSRIIGTTPVIMNTLDPVWNFESSFSFRMPKVSSSSFLSDDDFRFEIEQENAALVMTFDLFDK